MTIGRITIIVLLPTASQTRCSSLRLLHFILFKRQIVLHPSKFSRSRQLICTLQFLQKDIKQQRAEWFQQLWQTGNGMPIAVYTKSSVWSAKAGQ